MPNQVVDFPEKIAARLAAAGVIDPDPDAVDYALSIGAKVIPYEDTTAADDDETDNPKAKAKTKAAA